MKSIKLLKILPVAAALFLFGQCSVEPTYFTEITDEVYISSGGTAQAGVWQIMAIPFEQLRSRSGEIPRNTFLACNTLSADEILMPNRNGDWYDDGFYMNHRYHKWGPSTDGYWVYAYDRVMQDIVTFWDTYRRLDEIDFDAIEFEPGAKEWMFAQIKTMIAYYYLVGLDHFGGMPLYRNVQEGTSTETVGRSTDVETFEFIEQTLKEVIPVLNKNTEPFNGYFTQGAAAAVLARLYFNARPYIRQDRDDDCEKICNDIKNGVYGNYSLESDYRKVFGWDNEKSPEFIFGITSVKSFREVSAGIPHYGTHYNTMVYLDNKEALSWNGICLTPSQDMYGKHYRYETGNLGGPFKLGSPYDKFEDSDIRKQNYLYYGGGRYEGMFLAGKLVNPLTGGACTADGTREYPMGDTIPMVDIVAQISPFKDYPAGRKEGAMYAEENSGVRLMKFQPIPNEADNSIRFNPDVPLIRYAEIEFMLAEIAYNRGDLGTAATILNGVRSRYFTGSDPNPVTAGNLDKYRLADEWLIEFLGEGRRRTDLVRWGMYTTEAWWDHPADGPGQEFRNRFPISESAINAGQGKIQQNPGYGN
ncbi:MAG: RagB/SusD family nutrient uptake outer membrane protein [Tannerellaceae bacterium]|jgi:hypothetical protein|nr:RagB/SusD family nutrient uptake outer membrane protein [Tannerellaceae bacterium]